MNRPQLFLVVSCIVFILFGVASSLEPRLKWLVLANNVDLSPPSGLRFSASSSGLQSVANSVLPSLIAKFASGLRLPDISGSESFIDYSLTNIQLSQFSLSSIAPPVMYNGFQVTVTGISAQVNGDWEGHCCCIFGHCLSSSGGFSASTSSARLSFAGNLIATSDGHPQMTLTSVSADLGDLSISTSGSMLDGLLDLIVKLVKGNIKSAAENAISNAVQNQALSQINNLLSQYPTSFVVSQSPFPMQADMRLSGNAIWPSTSSETPYVAFNVVGAFEDPSGPKIPNLPSIRTHAVPQGAPQSGRMAEIDVDEFMINTAFALQDHYMPVSQKVYNGDVPNFALTTSTFASVLPDLARVYPSQTIMFSLVENSPPVYRSFTNGSLVTAYLNWTWSVSADSNPNVHQKVYTDAFTLNTSVTFATTVSFNNLDPRNPGIVLAANPLSASISLVWSNAQLGTFSVDMLSNFIQVLIPNLPLSLKQSFPIPTIPCAFLKNVNITPNDGFLSIVADLIYNGPPPSTGLCPVPHGVDALEVM